MSHHERFVMSVVFVVVISPISSNGQESTPSQTDNKTVAERVDAAAGLLVKGTIFIDESDKTAHNADDILPVKFIYSSVETNMKGHGFIHTDATSQVGEKLISDFLSNFPDLTPIYRQLINEKQVEDALPLATFSLRLVSQSDGYISILPEPAPDNRERLVFHQQAIRTSGLASVNFSRQHDSTDSEHFRLCLSIFQRFSKLVSALACQNIWVTIKSDNDRTIGLCWKDDFKVVAQETP